LSPDDRWRCWFPNRVAGAPCILVTPRLAGAWSGDQPRQPGPPPGDRARWSGCRDALSGRYRASTATSAPGARRRENGQEEGEWPRDRAGCPGSGDGPIRRIHLTSGPRARKVGFLARSGLGARRGRPSGPSGPTWRRTRRTAWGGRRGRGRAAVSGDAGGPRPGAKRLVLEPAGRSRAGRAPGGGWT
jgi:hypothetical protein